MKANSEIQPKLETWPQGKWHKPFSDLDKSDFKTVIIKRGFLLPSEETVTFFVHDIDFPENVSAEPKRKSLVVAVDNTSKEVAYEVAVRIATRPHIVSIGIPDLETKKMVYEDWEKEGAANDTLANQEANAANPFTCSYVELSEIEVKIT